MHITTIAVFVQSIRNQFILYDYKNKLCTCQPILLIFSGNNLFCQKDDIQHFETFKNDTNYRNFIPHPPLQIVSTDLHRSQKWPRRRRKKRKSAENFHPWIFQRYRGSQFYWWRKQESPEKNHRPVTSH